MIAFTLCSNNYLPYAGVLGDSLKKFHPHWTFVVGLVDKRLPDLDYGRFSFDDLLQVEDIQIDHFEEMVARYDQVELNTAVKPYYFTHLFKAYPQAESILFFDPDIRVFGDLSGLEKRFKTASILLVPHFSAPQRGQSGIITPEQRILQRGLYNLGFLGLKRSDVSAQMLAWWQEKMMQHCQRRPDKGLFVDQKWFDLVPLYFEQVTILKNLGYDLAYWNLYENRLHRSGDTIFAGEQPLRFYHFSAFEKEDSDYINRLAGRFEPAMSEILRELYSGYLQALEAAGLDEFRSIPFAYQRKPQKMTKWMGKVKQEIVKRIRS